ncbi:MAG TPA: hypothetical protein VGG45_04205 [Terracidiphilus sp.]
MQGIALQSGWETFLLAAPIVGMILVGVFRLDELAANSSRGPRPRVPGNDENGRALLTDPDGRSWTDSASAPRPSTN